MSRGKDTPTPNEREGLAVPGTSEPAILSHNTGADTSGHR